MRDPSPGAAAAPPTLPRWKRPSRTEVERGIARGRALHGAAVQASFARLLRLLAAGLGRSAQGTTARLPGRGHSCC